MGTAAQIAWKQISIHTKMACGARDPKAHSETKLSFKVHSKPLRYVEIEYLPGQDLYEVTYLRLKRGSYARVVMKQESGVYADSLSELIYAFVNRGEN